MKQGLLSGRKALVADDEAVVRATLVRLLRSLSLQVVDVADGLEATRKIAIEPFDLVLTDLFMPGLDGFGVIQSAKKHQPHIPVIILTGAGGVSDAVRAMREGAYDFLTKPFHPTALTDVVKAALTRTEGEAEGKPNRVTEVATDTGAVLLGKSNALTELLAVVDKVGPTDATVLISGETGSGKEVIARLLHAASSRAGERLLAVNCAAIPETLIESELFGHVKGAFTGAHMGRVGRLREAHGGTLLLDEIGELPLAMQARLLRVLQDHQVTPVGSERSYTIDVRFLAATNRDLEAMVREGRFRNDLYYRLNVVPLFVPPLRDRLEDVPQLALHFLEQAGSRLGRVLRLSDQALSLLLLYRWPGNVRELENLVERMAILDRDGVIDVDDLPPVLGQGVDSSVSKAVVELADAMVDMPLEVERFERSLIGTAMRKAGNNKSKAAQMLGIGRTTLIDKIRKLGL